MNLITWLETFSQELYSDLQIVGLLVGGVSFLFLQFLLGRVDCKYFASTVRPLRQPVFSLTTSD